MKTATYSIFALVCIFAATFAQAMHPAGLYYQQAQVQVSVNVMYRVQYKSAMCVFERMRPVWNQECGIQRQNVGGCSWQQGPMGGGYICGQSQIRAHICAWRLSYVPEQFQAVCPPRY